MNLIDAGSAQPAYARGDTLSAATVFQDLTVLTRAALNAMVYDNGIGSIPGAPDPGEWAHRLGTNDFRRTPTGRTGGACAATPPQFLLAQTAALHYLISDPDDLGDGWLSPRRIMQTRGLFGFTTTKYPPSRPLSALLGTVVFPGHRHSHVQTRGIRQTRDRIGRLRHQGAVKSLEPAFTYGLDCSATPAAIWSTVTQHAPDLPPRVARLFPISAPIVLISFGRELNLTERSGDLGYQIAEPTLQKMINALLINDGNLGTFDYLLGLQRHLLQNPPPIDYRRRRRLFPQPFDIGRNHEASIARAAGLRRTSAFKVRIQRYIWQLLTGGDPLCTTQPAVEQLSAQQAYDYRSFVTELDDSTRDAAGRVAQRLLLHHRIGEPVTYTPDYDPTTQTSCVGQTSTFITDIGRTDLRRSSRSLALALTTVGDTEELVHLALAGDVPVARWLCRFIATADVSTNEAATTLGIRTTTVTQEVRKIEAILGEPIFHRGEPYPATQRTLTGLGSELRTRCRANIDRLHQIAGREEKK